MIDPLPSINKVYFVVIQEESNNHSLSSSIGEPSSIINVVDSRKPQGRGRGYFSGSKPPRHCSFCGKNNHTIEYCDQKHGHPNPNFHKHNSSVNALSSFEEIEAQSRSCNDASSSSSSNISQEKYDRILSLLQQVNLLHASSVASPQTSVNHVHTSPASNSISTIQSGS
ncbi:uncharacterized protein [Medicago truncatula]|uniref:uncharacterized protein isoform X1 n=1 Tax=Medicago truncatula TaxID=3880 RepID=UPI001967BA7B|nr:uncharacterized protein LOC120579400 isoform X1 [Medicago truncatula]XP_039687399.1 uncharacterized protein LOC120579400 isoform X1 [Medicago truncatula]